MPMTIIPVAPSNFANNSGRITQIQDGNITKWVATLSGTANQGFGVILPLPANATALPVYVLRVRWRPSVAAAGSVVFGGSVDHYDALPYSYTGTAPAVVVGSLDVIHESVITITAGMAASGADVIAVNIYRDATNGGDTYTSPVEVLGVWLEYNSNSPTTQAWRFTPANACKIPGASSAAHAILAYGSGTEDHYHVLDLRDGFTDYFDAQITLPSNYSGGLTCYAIYFGGADNFYLKADFARAAAGSASDPAYTAGSYAAVAAATGTDPSLTITVTPAAGDIVYVRLSRDGAHGSDTATATLRFLGFLWIYNISDKNPQQIVLDPSTGSLPTGVAATVTLAADANSSKRVAQFPNSATRSADYGVMMPSNYYSGGTLRIKWRANAASGDAVFQIASDGLAIGGDSTAALGGSFEVTGSCAGANLINETEVSVVYSFAPGDNLFIRLSRLGSDADDTLAATVEVLEMSLETSVG